jgi:hypothetical protein
VNLAAFYHAWVGGAWQTPEQEFWTALRGSGFDGPVHELWEDAGSESPTINRVRQYAEHHDGAVLYAHTKGAGENTDFRTRWRRSMTNRVVADWRQNLARLEECQNCYGGYADCAECHGAVRDVDAVGCHWLTEAAFPGMFGPQTIPAEGSGFFGGNFWMARCDYLRTLPACEAEPRWKAESWIGLGNPRVVDLLPGWPDDNRWPELCGRG